MTHKQELFVEYLVAGNPLMQAAILAGFSSKTANVSANRCLKDKKIVALIEEKKAARNLEIQKKAQEAAEENWMATENIAKGFRDIYNRCMQAEPVMRFDGRTRTMVQATDEEGRGIWQFDSNGANRAWENIAKHVGFYEIDNSQKTPIVNVNLLQNNFYGDGEQAAGDNGELTDPSLFTLLPPSTEE